MELLIAATCNIANNSYWRLESLGCTSHNPRCNCFDYHECDCNGPNPNCGCDWERAD